MSDLDPCSFGTIATGIARFWVYVDQTNGNLPNWSSTPNIRTFTIAGSFPPRSEMQLVSFGPSTVTWKLECATRVDYMALLAKLGASDTLTVLANTQTHPGVYEDIVGVGFDHLTGTTLIALGNEQVGVEGEVQLDATFQRHIDPRTGLVVS